MTQPLITIDLDYYNELIKMKSHEQQLWELIISCKDLEEAKIKIEGEVLRIKWSNHGEIIIRNVVELS